MSASLNDFQTKLTGKHSNVDENNNAVPADQRKEPLIDQKVPLSEIQNVAKATKPKAKKYRIAIHPAIQEKRPDFDVGNEEKLLQKFVTISSKVKSSKPKKRVAKEGSTTMSMTTVKKTDLNI